LTKVGLFLMHHTQVMRAQLPNQALCGRGGGYFDHLIQHVSLGFDRTHDDVVQYLCSSEGSNDGGILFWSNTMKHSLQGKLCGFYKAQRQATALHWIPL
jgi:hypothetical protein